MYNARIPAIKEWVEQDRPREKFVVQTGMNLSNAELIAILIGSGSRYESAVHLGQRILESVDGDLGRLAELSIQDLSRFKGIGLAKAVAIAAAVELCYKRMCKNSPDKYLTGSSADTYQMITAELEDITEASWWAFLFNGAGILMNKHQVGDTMADPRVILQTVLEHQATSFLLVRSTVNRYNQPRASDKAFIQSLIESANMLSLCVLDHLVIHPEGYFSFRDAKII